MAMNESLLSFSPQDVSATFQTIPNSYGLIGQLGLFSQKSIPTTYVTVEEQNGVLTLLPSNTKSAPASIANKGRRKKYFFEVPKIEHNDVVLPEDIQNLQAFGSNMLQNMSNFLAERLGEIKLKHDLTLEWLMKGALNGLVIDGDGSTELADYFTAFGITEKTVDFVLGTSSTNVIAKCDEVTRHIRKEIKGDMITGFTALVPPGFMDKFIIHPEVNKYYLNWSNAMQISGGDPTKGFLFRGINFVEYDATVTTSEGVSAEFYTSAATGGRCFPTGTRNTFKLFAAPADFNESINTQGQLYYAKTLENEMGRGWKIHTQSNPLPMCVKPQVLVKVYSSN